MRIQRSSTWMKSNSIGFAGGESAIGNKDSKRQSVSRRSILTTKIG